MPKLKTSKEDVVFNPDTASAGEETKDETKVEEEGEKNDETTDTVKTESGAEVKISNPLEDKKVKIRLRENHFCNIGGESYRFKKGEVYVVPHNVKRVLMEANLLTSL